MSYFSPYTYNPRNGIQQLPGISDTRNSNGTSLKKPDHHHQLSGLTATLDRKLPVVGGLIDADQAVRRDLSESRTEGQDPLRPPKKERRNRPGQRFGAKKKLWVWSWFAQDLNNPNVAACDFCGKIIVRLASDKGSPKKLSEHLKTHKLSKDTINYSRQVPVDGHGVTYTTSGDPVGYAQDYSEQLQAAAVHHIHQQHQINHTKAHSQSTSNLQQAHQTHVQHPQLMQHQVQSVSMRSPPSTEKSQMTTFTPPTTSNFSNRFVLADFDNTPYSLMKFHKHLMKFLTENKLPIHVIKLQSFQQLIYDLRSDSVSDLLELTSLYSSLLEVSRYGETVEAPEESQAVNALASVVENKMQ